MRDVLLLDYGVGNLHSIGKALARHGVHVRLTAEADAAIGADILVLPGVGAFGAAAAKLKPIRGRMRAALRAGLPGLGICLGMHLLFEESEEGEGRGLGLIPGRVRRLRARRVPHMGWNTVAGGGDPLFDGIVHPTLYFANGYVGAPAAAECIIAWSQHEQDRFPAAVRQGRTWGVQFHPEKSGADGLRLLDNFMELARS